MRRGLWFGSGDKGDVMDTCHWGNTVLRQEVTRSGNRCRSRWGRLNASDPAALRPDKGSVLTIHKTEMSLEASKKPRPSPPKPILASGVSTQHPALFPRHLAEELN